MELTAACNQRNIKESRFCARYDGWPLFTLNSLKRRIKCFTATGGSSHFTVKPKRNFSIVFPVDQAETSYTLFITDPG
jgi:hypothetical protein